MNPPNNNFQNMLAEWGRTQRVLPAQNEALKNEILGKLHSAPAEKIAKAFRIPWLSFGLAGAAVVILVMSQATGQLGHSVISTEQATGLRNSESSSLGSAFDSAFNKSAPDVYYPSPPQTQVPSTDTREFLKKNYGASLKSRHVSELTRRIETIVRGFGGRIDNSSNSEKSGFVSFVVPADKFEVFRNEIESLVGKKFFTENIQTQNLLPEKRSIEKQQSDTQENLAKLRSDRDQLVANHNNTAASLQAQINSASKQIANLQSQPQTPEIEAQKQALQNKINSLKGQVAAENKGFTANLSSFDNQIQYAEMALKNLSTQNTQLLDNVATVNGTISINWISLWEALNLYLPTHWLPTLLILTAIIIYLIRRRKTEFIIP